FQLNDDEKGGLQVFVVVASREPLPSYNEWRKQRGPAPWQRLAGGDKVWHCDGNKIDKFNPERRIIRGQVVPLLSQPPLMGLCQWTRGGEAELVVDALAFPVNPMVK